MTPTPERRRILFLDAYDSFSNNITSLLTTLLGVDVFVLPIDSPLLDPLSSGFREKFRKELAHYDAVVCGPGPGSPENELDVGLMRHVWGLQDEALLPVMGVCLGFQSLVAACGGKIRRLRRGLHGMVREIVHRDDADSDIFSGVVKFNATLYHSLSVDIGQDDIPEDEWQTSRWKAPAGYMSVRPLAWVEELRSNGTERILMAARHPTKPFWGIQYHPESVCTEAEGDKVIANWFQEALHWNKLRGRTAILGGGMLAYHARRPSLLAQLSDIPDSVNRSAWWQGLEISNILESKTVVIPMHVQAPDVLEALEKIQAEAILLDSANAAAAAAAKADVRGRFSIIALDLEEMLRVEHHAGDNYAMVKLKRANGLPISLSQEVSLDRYHGIWGFLADFHRARQLEAEDAHDTPFLGGFMGYVTYEQGLQDIGLSLPEDRGHHRPDVCLVWVTKSMVIDHAKSLLHIQHLRQPVPGEQESWVEQMAARLAISSIWHHSPSQDLAMSRKEQLSGRRRPSMTIVRAPQTKEYEMKVKQCQEYIAAGESYELCLTDQTKIVRPRSELAPGANETAHCQTRRRSSASTAVASSWQLFRALRSRQPAPFASYLRLGDATLVSASPERFLQFNCSGLCSMRPMKGTVRKSDTVPTLSEAEKVLHVPKEEAENLMIVDLVRHDLYAVCGAGNVSVPHLLKVEEYQSVFQMITVVEGQLHRSEGGAPGAEYSGLDILAASLPPGSMTGAPKKRSCELLSQIEMGKERSLYSGVVGYMCVTGAGDWSVTIRSMYRWQDEQTAPEAGGEPQEVWNIGAGGAVTILSTPEGEREEMFTKLAGPLGIFGGSG